MTAITRELAEFVAATSYAALPVQVRERAKFDGLTAPYLSAQRRDEIASRLLALDQAQDIGALLRLTRSEAGGARKMATAGR
jgi:hypothetical protein